MKKVANTKTNIDNLPFGVELSQFIYFIFAIGGTLSIAVNILWIREFDFDFFWTLITVGVFWALFYGTYKIKSWVVTPVLVYSAFGTINTIIGILSFHPTNKSEFAWKGFQIIMLSFFLFQLIIFSRKSTKDFFKVKGTTVVS